jgi:hypothetical protein
MEQVMEEAVRTRATDAAFYLEEVGLDEVPAGYVLHHSEPGNLQLIRIDYHETFTHHGGYNGFGKKGG